MKRFWTKVLFYMIAIWTISACYSAMVDSRQTVPVIPPREQPATFELLTDGVNISEGPKISSESAILFDLNSGQVMIGKNVDEVRSIASLTKVATAMVFLASSPDLLQIATVTREDKEGAGHSRLYTGEMVTLYDIFHLALICSDNVAARILARSSGVSADEFVAHMNGLASYFNLSHTHFVEPTGLDSANVSTAAEYAIIFRAALEYDLISEVISKKSHSFTPVNRNRRYTIHNTNRLLGRYDIIGGKTGYTCESGYCLALGVKGTDGKKLAAIVLGAPSSGYRFRDAAKLLTSLDITPHARN